MPVFWRFGIHLLGELCDSGGGSFALGDAMAKPRDDRQKDLLRPALEAIIDLGHPPVRLAREIDWTFLDRRFADVCTPVCGSALRWRVVPRGTRDEVSSVHVLFLELREHKGRLED